MKNITRLGLFVALGSAVLAACSTPSSSSVGGERVAQQVVIDNGDVLMTSSSVGKPLTSSEKEAMSNAKQVVHTFSNGFKLNVVNDNGYFRGPGGDILIAKAQDLGDRIQVAEDALHKNLSGQGTGLNPQGCSSWFLWTCVYPTSAFIWGSAGIPYEISGAFTNTERAQIVNIIGEWNSALDSNGVRMKPQLYPKTSPSQNAVIISKIPSAQNGGCIGNSFIGNQRSGNSQAVIISCINPKGILFHELGHAAGLWHEQSRCDRDAFVTVSSSDYLNFGKYCGADGRLYGKYDYDSVMHYEVGTYQDGSKLSIAVNPPTNQYSGSPISVGQRSRLSQGDVDALNTMY